MGIFSPGSLSLWCAVCPALLAFYVLAHSNQTHWILGTSTAISRYEACIGICKVLVQKFRGCMAFWGRWFLIFQNDVTVDFKQYAFRRSDIMRLGRLKLKAIDAIDSIKFLVKLR
ncbi:hypothetical protein ACLB2K_001139 [Fragaria x ananassa]